jgi:hypothetical protein
MSISKAIAWNKKKPTAPKILKLLSSIQCMQVCLKITELSQPYTPFIGERTKPSDIVAMALL